MPLCKIQHLTGFHNKQTPCFFPTLPLSIVIGVIKQQWLSFTVLMPHSCTACINTERNKDLTLIDIATFLMITVFQSAASTLAHNVQTKHFKGNPRARLFKLFLAIN